MVIVGADASGREDIQATFRALGVTQLRFVHDISTAVSAIEAMRDDREVAVGVVTGPDTPPVVSPDALGHFAHEAAAPLLIVTMLSEVMLDDETLTSTQREDLRKIHEAGSQLSKMLKEFKSGR